MLEESKRERVRERETERDRERQTDRERERERDRQTDRQTDRETERQRERHREREKQRDREREKQRDTEREKQRDRERDRQTDRDRQRQRQRERQRDRDRETETERALGSCPYTKSSVLIDGKCSFKERHWRTRARERQSWLNKTIVSKGKKNKTAAHIRRTIDILSNPNKQLQKTCAQCQTKKKPIRVPLPHRQTSVDLRLR